MTATSDTIGESQPPGDQSRESQLEAVKDNPPRAQITQRLPSFTLKTRALTTGSATILVKSNFVLPVAQLARGREARGRGPRLAFILRGYHNGSAWLVVRSRQRHRRRHWSDALLPIGGLLFGGVSLDRVETRVGDQPFDQ